MKSVFPTVEEYLLLDVLSNSDNNVQKAGDRLVKMGYVKRDTPSKYVNVLLQYLPACGVSAVSQNLANLVKLPANFNIFRRAPPPCPTQGGRAAGREEDPASQAAGHQDGQGEGGAEEEDEDEVRGQV